MRFIKILLTGSGAAGKTSFSNLLMKNKFTDVHHSTNIVQAKHAISAKIALVLGAPNDEDVVWLEMDKDSQISQLRQILFALDPPKMQNIEKPNCSSDSVNLLSESSNSALSNTESNQGARYIKHCETETNSKFAKRFTNGIHRLSLRKKLLVKSEMLTSFETLVENSIRSTVFDQHLHHSGEVLNIITLLDTGGQPEYIHLLPTINIHPMITFVVHNLSKPLEDQVLVEFSKQGRLMFEPYHLKYSNFDMIKFLMSSINDSSERTSSQAPQLVTIPGKNKQSYVCCVGTHADRVAADVIRNVDGQLTAMVEKLDCKSAVWLNEAGKVLYSVDNTTAGDDSNEDPIAKQVRNKIDNLASNKDVYELPITWMLFELEIRHLCASNQKAYIAVQECVAIAMDSGLITDEDEVKNALAYHHLLGVLLYYPEVAGLCDYVIVDHQWLFDQISSIVCFTFKHSSNLHAKNKLSYHGILTNEALQELNWNEELREEYFIALLVEMKIVAPIKKEDSNAKDYFIPYILPTYTNQSQRDNILCQYGKLQGQPLLIQFVSNLLPRGFFCCLAVEMLQRLPKDWGHVFTQKDAHHTYSNLITFRLQNAYSLSLMDKLSYLEVQIRHREQKYYHQFPVHIEVRDILAKALENVCEQLTYNHGRLQYGFHCQCGEHDEHIALLAGLTPPFDYALCRYGSMVPTKLDKGHTVWLTEVSVFYNVDNMRM